MSQGISTLVNGKYTFRRDFEIQLSIDTESRSKATTSSITPSRKSQISYFAFGVRQLLQQFVATVKSQYIVTGALRCPPFFTKRLWKMEHLVKYKCKVNIICIFLIKFAVSELCYHMCDLADRNSFFTSSAIAQVFYSLAFRPYRKMFQNKFIILNTLPIFCHTLFLFYL